MVNILVMSGVSTGHANIRIRWRFALIRSIGISVKQRLVSRVYVVLVAAIAAQGCAAHSAPSASSDVEIVNVYRSGCNADGSSGGLAVRILIIGHAGELLGAG